MFIKSLDKHFQDNLNSRLSISGKARTLPADQSTVRGEDPYDWEEVVKQAVELVSGKTIAKALQYDQNPESHSRAIPPQVKRERSEAPPDSADWREEMASLKDTMNINQKSMQSYMDSLKSTLQTKVSRPSNPMTISQAQPRQQQVQVIIEGATTVLTIAIDGLCVPRKNRT